jgi:hypothetical protein
LRRVRCSDRSRLRTRPTTACAGDQPASATVTVSGVATCAARLGPSDNPGAVKNRARVTVRRFAGWLRGSVFGIAWAILGPLAP